MAKTALLLGGGGVLGVSWATGLRDAGVSA